MKYARNAVEIFIKNAFNRISIDAIVQDVLA